MVFSSGIFLFGFLPLTLVVNYLLSRTSIHLQNGWLLLASLFFYFWGEPKNIVLMLLSIGINYFFGLVIHGVRLRTLFLRRFVLGLGVFMNLVLLLHYKYLDFFTDLINTAFSLNYPLKEIMLPIGISFFTFQGISYIVDLYWGNTTVQKNPFRIALYISLFPQLIAGPIVRYKDIAQQISCRTVSSDDVYGGIQRFIIGLAKKVLIANNVAVVADSIFGAPYNENTATSAWLGLLCYTFQIYFDFSGYSDMAIGLGKMMGFTFLENFNYPYLAKSIQDFWRRWHISLSTFFRDYIYIPIGGNRKGNVYLHLFIVFFLTGLWHGASLTFIVWGLWHGLFLVLERVFFPRMPAPKSTFWKRILFVLGHLYTLLVVLIGWVFFRADTLSYAFGYLCIMFGLSHPNWSRVGFTVGHYLDYFLVCILIVAVFACGPLSLWYKNHFGHLAQRASSIAANRAVLIRSLILTVLFFATLVFVINSNYNPFIYFRF